MQKNITCVKLGCYITNISMAVVSNLSPLLFITFRNAYGISYSLLGALVLVNFFTQLTVDLIFSFFSHKFNIAATVKWTPVLTVIGLLAFALLPLCFPQIAYWGLLLGTVIFSASSGLAEVLISPTIAAIPAENPDQEMSKLHSVYAWGVVGVILVSTLFLLFVGDKYWNFLALAFISIPLSAAILFAKAELPKMETPEKVSGALAFLKDKGLWLCVVAIFLGGATECTMAQWASGYLEKAVGIPKVLGDVFGVALFGVALGLGRTLYSKKGKNVERVLLLGCIGAAVCYLTAAVCDIAVVGLLACAFTGFCASMLWPGSLIVSANRFPQGGVFIYAMMAAGGDFGASVGPQLVGVITDGVMGNAAAAGFAQSLGLTVEQLGMKCGMLVGAIFPILGIIVFSIVCKIKKKADTQGAGI